MLNITSIISIIILLIIIAMYISNKKENMNIENMNIENKDAELNPIIGKPKMQMIPNCNMLNDRNVCSNTKGCVYDNTTLGCYYDWPNS
jgi:hypothetical protein